LADLAGKVQRALDEGRILILGTQVLLGIGFRMCLEPGFEALPAGAKDAKLFALGLELAAFALAAAPAARHRLVEQGEDTRAFHRFARGALGVALFPLGLGLGLDVAVGAIPIAGPSVAAALGAVTGTAALATWYAWTSGARARRPGRAEEENEMATPSLDRKIQHVLTEARMMIPGAQALLGFQLAATLMARFGELPRALKLLHLGAVGLTAAAVILLVAPAAYDRIAEGGEPSERFHRIASRLLVASCPALAFALAAQLAIVAYAASASRAVATGLGLAAAVAFHALWFGLPLAERARRSRSPPLRPPAPTHARARG
jgi:hypothetical protein